MKILMVNKFLYPNGGSETYIFKLGEQLKKEGHEVEYFGMEHEGRIVGNRVESYTSDMDFHTGKLKKLLYPLKIVYSLEARKKLRPVLEDFQPDAVHLNNFNFQLTPSILYEIRKYEKKAGKKIRIIYTAHDYQLVCPNHLLLNPQDDRVCEKCVHGGTKACVKGKCIHGSGAKSLIGGLEGWLYRRLHAYRMIDTVICPSGFMKEKLSFSEDLKGKLVVMHNFVDPEEIPDGGKKNYVLYFGRYCKEKGVETLLKACGNLPDIPFVFAGGGPLEEDVNRTGNVRNKGFLTGSELVRTVAQAAFVVFPSEWYENCPFTVMEAQIYGTPVLASDLGGTGELVKDGMSGELFEAGNQKQLEEKIRRLWTDTGLREKYTRGCREVRFDTTEEYCGKLLEIYTRRITDAE